MPDPVIKIVNLDTIATWLDTNSDGPPAAGAGPTYDGTQLLWSSQE